MADANDASWDDSEDINLLDKNDLRARVLSMRDRLERVQNRSRQRRDELKRLKEEERQRHKQGFATPLGKRHSASIPPPYQSPKRVKIDTSAAKPSTEAEEKHAQHDGTADDYTPLGDLDNDWSAWVRKYILEIMITAVVEGLPIVQALQLANVQAWKQAEQVQPEDMVLFVQTMQSSLEFNSRKSNTFSRLQLRQIAQQNLFRWRLRSHNSAHYSRQFYAS
jgi:hypothetical protein